MGRRGAAREGKVTELRGRRGRDGEGGQRSFGGESEPMRVRDGRSEDQGALRCHFRCIVKKRLRIRHRCTLKMTKTTNIGTKKELWSFQARHIVRAGQTQKDHFWLKSPHRVTGRSLARRRATEMLPGPKRCGRWQSSCFASGTRLRS